MSSYVNVLILLTITAFSSSDVFNNGQQKYEQILSLSSTSTCWQDVLIMLQKYCSIDELDKYQSKIAYQFTLCHLSAMNDDSSNILCQQTDIELCVENLHQHMNAFIATFHRVSRQLKRARSKSRSRSRSIRLRQREDRHTSPLTQTQSQFIDHDENKENVPQNTLIDDENDQSFVHYTNKLRYSRIIPKSSKSTRILLGSKQINNTIDNY
ncbi:unnamed protein product [Rotaria magnacalcarata]|uniref:Uncharacterized protein n=1 Tax=Rotaria magnacalcarata TaxID=392030 RepID=A0A8S2KTD8_9BILA|nr:unnamed protein product [Rotaria magnacalcarata]